MDPKILENGIIRLRPVEPEDADFMWTVESDSTQWIQNALVAPFSRENLLQYAHTYEADPFLAGQIRLIIEDINRQNVGIADLYEISAQHRNAYVGMYILPQYRGKGLGKESLGVLEDYASRLLNLEMLGSKIVDINEASMALFLKSGYEWSGTLRQWIIAGHQKYSLHLLQKAL